MYENLANGYTGGCTTVLHLLLKHPILVVAVGIAAAVKLVSPFAYEEKLNDPATQTELAQIENKYTGKIIPMIVKNPTFQKHISGKDPFTPPEINTLLDSWWEGIKMVESKNKHLGVHPDGVSFGIAGLTKEAAEDMLEKMPMCDHLGYQDILNDPDLNEKFSHLYFLSLVHEFEDVEIAVIAYNNGPTKIRKWIKAGKKLPTGYLKHVKKAKEQIEWIKFTQETL